VQTRTLLLVRHGETLWNAEGRWQGQTDVPLSDTGREQARLLGVRLGRLWENGALPAPFVALASDLARAQETATLVLASAGHPLPVETTPDLRERSFGSWEGKTMAEVGFAPGSGERPPDAESYEQVWARTTHVLERLWSAEDACALVVGHGGSLRCFLAHAAGLGADGVRRFALKNTALCVVTFTGNTLSSADSRLLRVGDTSHLES
jgi:broad specificity phosphatase PhoE